MTDERQQALESLGFVWDSHWAIWEERLNELVAFRDDHGHCNVPANFEGNPPLSIWVKVRAISHPKHIANAFVLTLTFASSQCQRRQYKLFRSGQKSNMTEERIAKLDSVGFSWTVFERSESP